MSLGNPTKGFTLISGGVVGNTLAAALAPASVGSIQYSDSLDVIVKVTTVGNVTDLRVRPFISVDPDADPYDPTALDSSWTPVPTETITAGVATQSPYEAKFLPADWFSVADRAMSFRIPAVGTQVSFAVYDGAGDGSGSSIDLIVYPRRV